MRFFSRRPPENKASIRSRRQQVRQPKNSLLEGSQAFKRSSNLTGSNSARVKVAAEERGQLQTARMMSQKKQQKVKKVQRRLARAFAAVFVVIFLWANHINGFAIVFVDQNLANTPSKVQYQETAMAISRSQPASQFVPSISRKALADNLLAKHPEIKKVTIKTQPFSRKPQLFITFRQPVLMWKTSQQEKPYYVDEQGTAFATNVFANDDSLVKVNDASGIPAELGSSVVSSRQIAFLGQLVGQVREQSKGEVKVSKITFPASSTKQIDLNFENRPYYAKAYLERQPVEEAKEIVASIQYFNQRNITPEYIDVRVPDRAFYR